MEEATPLYWVNSSADNPHKKEIPRLPVTTPVLKFVYSPVTAEMADASVLYAIALLADVIGGTTSTNFLQLVMLIAIQTIMGSMFFLFIDDLMIFNFKPVDKSLLILGYPKSLSGVLMLIPLMAANYYYLGFPDQGLYSW